MKCQSRHFKSLSIGGFGFMREFEESAGNAAATKEKIRARYKGINPDELEVIPALPKENIFEENKMRRVAVYARVSTGDPR